MGRAGPKKDVEEFLEKIGPEHLENWRSPKHYGIKDDYDMGMRCDHQGVRLPIYFSHSGQCR